MSKYYIEYGALQANGKRLIECETSALDAKKITEDFAREIADALNGREAWKQEKAEIEADSLAVGGIVEAARTAEKSSAVGNAAAMREALEKIAAMEVPHNFQCERSDIADACYDLTRAIKNANDALSAPPRNCDVGTEQERHRRFLTFCNAHVDCVDCPIKAYWAKALSCGILWDQMPYDAEEGGAQ